MDLARKRKDPGTQSKKDKKLKKLISKSDSDSDESEHELSFYLNDRIKLMKEVLKIIKPKKIKSMAPDCIKNLDNEEINSMLLEELLGISNKRLKYIFNGQHLEEDSSSTDPEMEQQPIDVISLDDVTDDDFVIDLDSDNDTEKKQHKKHGKLKIKQECKRKKIKKEKQDKTEHSKPSKKSKDPEKDKMDEQNLMSVLELLELQARARAIRSQLALETSKKIQAQKKNEENEAKTEESDNDDAIIIESPKNIEIIITSSESENEDSIGKASEKRKSASECTNDSGGNEKIGQEDEVATKKTTRSSTDINNKELKGNDESEDQSATQQDSEQNQVDETNKMTEDGGENKDVSTRDKSSDDKTSQAKNKITNVETIIISPAKNSTTSGNAKKDKESKRPKDRRSKLERQKSKDNDSGSEKVEMKTEKLEDEVKRDPNETESYKTQTSVTDEGDGIIINMEQSEIDCIISD